MSVAALVRCVTAVNQKGGIMTASMMMEVLGKRVEVECKGMGVLCTVVDVKSVYGCVRYQVEPVQGSGRVWVEQGSVR